MKLFSWGANSHGQLGLGVISEQCVVSAEVDTRARGPFDPGHVDAIVGGGGHSLVLTTDEQVYGCGWNASGQLGCGHYNDANTFSLVSSLTSRRVKVLACGWDWSAALTQCGQLFTWGSNTFCQLGLPTSQIERVAQPVSVTTFPLTQVACGMRHMAAVTECGRVLVWGSSRRRALGVADELGKPAECISRPTEVAGVEDVARVACGQHHTVALTSAGRVYVWGDNRHGQLGLDPTLHPSVPTPTELPLPGRACISARSQLVSGWTHSAVVTDDGQVINWGRNCYGQLGRPESDRPAPWRPQVVEGLSQVKTLVAGSEHNVALLGDGRLVSWGWNEHGNCGTGNTQDVWRPQPVAPSLLKNVVCVGSGYGHSYAVADS